MALTSTEANDTFERLLTAMPRIAEAVNAFSSEENQRAALDALVRALGIPPAAPATDDALQELHGGSSSYEEMIPAEDGESDSTSADVATGKIRSNSRRRRSVRKTEPVRDLNFRPEEKQSFKDFAEEKQPKSNDERNLLAVFWLEQVAGMQGITLGHVMAAYKDRDWREPANPANALQATASREHWIDTKDMKAIITTPSGRNQVKFEMPMQKTKK